MCVLAIACSASAQQLEVGDPAPPIAIEEFVCGEPIEAFAPGQVYIIEFWAGWSRACVDNMPHLSRLSRELGPSGVTVIGINVLEEPDQARKLVRKMKQRGAIHYTIAIERTMAGVDPARGGVMTNTWLRATGQCAVPMAFLIDGDARIAWMGHSAWPPGELETFAKTAAEGSLTPERASELREKWARIGALCTSVHEQARAGEYDAALASLDELRTLSAAAADAFALSRFEILLFGLRDEDRAYAHAREAVRGPLHNDAWELNALAWMIVDEPGVSHREYDLAIEAAKRACDLTDWRNAAILDTLAKAYFDSGRREEGLQLQEKAVRYAEDTRWEHELRKRLEHYRHAMQCDD